MVIVVARFTTAWGEWAQAWEVELIGAGDLRGGEGVTDWCGLGTLWGDWVAMTFTKKGVQSRRDLRYSTDSRHYWFGCQPGGGIQSRWRFWKYRFINHEYVGAGVCASRKRMVIDLNNQGTNHLNEP